MRHFSFRRVRSSAKSLLSLPSPAWFRCRELRPARFSMFPAAGHYHLARALRHAALPASRIDYRHYRRNGRHDIFSLGRTPRRVFDATPEPADADGRPFRRHTSRRSALYVVDDWQRSAITGELATLAAFISSLSHSSAADTALPRVGLLSLKRNGLEPSFSRKMARLLAVEKSLYHIDSRRRAPAR